VFATNALWTDSGAESNRGQVTQRSYYCSNSIASSKHREDQFSFDDASFHIEEDPGALQFQSPLLQSTVIMVIDGHRLLLTHLTNNPDSVMVPKHDGSTQRKHG
jgi:hypothetical protein